MAQTVITDMRAADALALIRGEVDAVSATLASGENKSLDDLVAALVTAPRVFVFGLGRSGLAVRMTAMRLMHLGLQVCVVGEVTTPGIGTGDLLLVASGSGTTGGVVRAAENAARAGASIAAITTDAGSPLARIATTTVIVPAADKLDRSGGPSAQYAGSLFEQAVVLLGDAAFHAIWQESGRSADDLWPLHANLE